MRIEAITVGQLRAFAESEIAKAGPNGWVPITRQRAVAQAANPYAVADDVALLVAYSGDKCVGYLGILPGRLRDATCFHKVNWVSTIFVEPAYRNHGTAVQLLESARFLGYDLIAAEAADSAARLYRACRFRAFGPLVSYRATAPPPDWEPICSFPMRIARRVGVAVGLDSPSLAKRIEGCRARYASFRRAGTFAQLAKLLNGDPDALTYERSNEPFAGNDQPNFDLSPLNIRQPHFYRGPEIADWMLRYKWVLPQAEARDNVRYPFSNTRHSFFFVRLSLFGPSLRPAGEAVLSISRRSETDPGNMKVLDFRLESETSTRAFVGVLLDAASRAEIAAIDFPSELRLGPFAGDGPLVVESRQREYFCVSAKPDGPLASALGDIALSFCDGDTPFV